MTTEDTGATPEKKTDEKPKREPFGAKELVDWTLDRYWLIRSDDGRIYLTPRNLNAPNIAREVNAIKGELRSALLIEGKTPSKETMSTAIETLAAIGEAKPVTDIALRAKHKSPAIYLDLGTADGTYVEVSPFGWEVIRPLGASDAEPAHDPMDSRTVWRRTRATAALPEPQRHEHGEQHGRDILRDLLGFDADDPRWRQAYGWLVGAMFESIPRPILWVTGPQGSGKSTRARMLVNLLDPVAALGREPGRNERDDATQAAARFVVTYDNVTNVSTSTSDFLCRLVTGVTIDRRALYTDDDLLTQVIKRTAVATSVVKPAGLKPDALERLVLLELERVTRDDRRPEAELWEAYEQQRGRILGGLLDDVVGVLRNEHTAKQTRGLPRMGDYGVKLIALDLHLGADPATGYFAAYVTGVDQVMAARALDDPLTAALIGVARQGGGTWTGTMEQLLKRIENDRPSDPKFPWPHGARGLSAAMTVQNETLRAAGLTWETYKSGTRKVRLTLLPGATEDAEPTPEVTDEPKPMLRVDNAADLGDVL